MTPVTTPVPLELADAAKALPPERQQAIEHRFRHALSQGLVSPLLHLTLRHEQNRLPCLPSP
jgi:DNA-directed RNA polymerase specialized sigma24 family protein